jgi:uncharacterized protein (DUF2062 family)
LKRIIPAKLRGWLHRHSLRLLAIRDTPEAIAGGVAIGVYFGFAPLFGFKTILAIFFAWLTGSNILAAVIAGTLHDLILPLMPLIYRWEYDLGYWLLSNPHRWPPALTSFHLDRLSWRIWSSFVSMGKPLLVGGLLAPIPFTAAAFFITRQIVSRHQRKRKALPPPSHLEAEEEPENPS